MSWLRPRQSCACGPRWSGLRYTPRHAGLGHGNNGLGRMLFQTLAKSKNRDIETLVYPSTSNAHLQRVIDAQAQEDEHGDEDAHLLGHRRLYVVEWRASATQNWS